jgi:hypothetical protein
MACCFSLQAAESLKLGKKDGTVQWYSSLRVFLSVPSLRHTPTHNSPLFLLETKVSGARETSCKISSSLYIEVKAVVGILTPPLRCFVRMPPPEHGGSLGFDLIWGTRLLAPSRSRIDNLSYICIQTKKRWIIIGGPPCSCLRQNLRAPLFEFQNNKSGCHQA